HPPVQTASLELDGSWQQALGVALREGLRFGHDIVFTYGPLGYFSESPYDAALFWNKLFAWEIGYGLAVACFFVLASSAGLSLLERILLFLALLLPETGQDAWRLLSIVAITSWLFARASRGPLAEGLGLLVLAVAALTKFTYLLYACVAAAAYVLWLARTRSP